MGGRALLGLFGGLVLLAGYQVGWYGLVMLRGLTGPGVQGGIGFLDLLVPGRNANGEVDAKLAGPIAPQTGSFGPPPSGGGQVGNLPGGAGGVVPPGGYPGTGQGSPGQNYSNA